MSAARATRIDYLGAPSSDALWTRCEAARRRGRLDGTAYPATYGWTDSGQLRVPARVGKVGVLVYRDRFGGERREYRSDVEAFDPASLATLEGVPLVLPEDHADLVSASDWKEKIVGIVLNPRRDGDFIAADLLIGDEATAKRVAKGELCELSCGYVAESEPSSRSDADVEQKGIRYNHVALLERGRARAGRDVRVLIERVTNNMQRKDTNMTTRRADSIDTESLKALDDEQLAKLAELVATELESRKSSDEKQREDDEAEEREREARADSNDGIMAKARRIRDQTMADAWRMGRR